MHNNYRENSAGSLDDCLKVIKHSRSTGEAVSLQTITEFLGMSLNNISQLVYSDLTTNLDF